MSPTIAAIVGQVSSGMPFTDNPRADFSTTPLWVTFLKALFIFIYLLLSTLIVIWMERRLVGRMQQRPGPNRNGPFGLLQSLADGLKSFMKEDITPANADKIIYTIAPMIAAMMSFVSFSIIPLAGPVRIPFTDIVTPFQVTDASVAVLLVLAVAGVGVYGIVLAGWSSGSSYPLMGGLRSTAQMVSYEIAMGLSLVAVFLYAGSMSTSQIVGAQQSIWNFIPLIFSFAVYYITMLGETNRIPFDLPEGEGEIVGGFHTEYGAMRFAMFFIAEYINMFTVSALATTVFLGGYLAPPFVGMLFGGALATGWWGLLWFTIKMWIFMFTFIWLRGTLPRVRYDQFMRFGWKFLIPATLVWVTFVAFFRAAQNGWLGEAALNLAGRRFPVSTLVVVGIAVIVALAGLELFDRKLLRTEAIIHAEIPDEIDPFAGGHPVPPLPGQRLREPSDPNSAGSLVTLPVAPPEQDKEPTRG